MFTKASDLLLQFYVEKRELIRDKAIEQWKNQRGAGAVEYALVIAVVVTLVVAAAKAMDTPLNQFFNEAVQQLRDWLNDTKTAFAA